MAEIQGQNATVGGKVDPERVVARIGRLRQSLKRADGDRKTELEQELARHQAELERMQQAISDA